MQLMRFESGLEVEETEQGTQTTMDPCQITPLSSGEPLCRYWRLWTITLAGSGRCEVASIIKKVAFRISGQVGIDVTVSLRVLSGKSVTVVSR